MSNFKDFDAMLAEKVGGRPSFQLCGEKFECRSKLPWRKWNAMILSLQLEDNTAEDTVENFFNLVLVKQDRERFFALIDKEDEDDDEETFVSDEQIGKVMSWLLDYYTGKAEQSDESSSDKPPTTGRPAKRVSLSRPSS